MTVENSAIEPSSPSPLNEGADYWNTLIDEKPAAEFLGCSYFTLREWRSNGSGPPFFRLAKKCIRYRRADLKAWADRSIVNPEAA